MRVAILSPISTSLFSRIMTYALRREPGIEVGVVIVRSPWSLRRLRSEFRRDGAHLVRKIAQKMVLGDERFGDDDRDTQIEVAREMGLPGRSLRDLTEELGIPLVGCSDHNADAAVSALSRAAPDVIVFTGGGLLRQRVLSIPRLGTLNCHPGILPKYRGMDVVEWTAMNSEIADPGLGLTVHFMDSGLDTGPIVSTHRITLRADDDCSRVRRRMERDCVQCLLNAVRGLRDGMVEPRPQAPGDGKQYYVMHPTLHAIAQRRLQAARPHSD